MDVRPCRELKECTSVILWWAECAYCLTTLFSICARLSPFGPYLYRPLGTQLEHGAWKAIMYGLSWLRVTALLKGSEQGEFSVSAVGLIYSNWTGLLLRAAVLQSFTREGTVKLFLFLIKQYDMNRDGEWSRAPPKNGVFWDVTPCGSCKNRRLGGT
jgi:hypothetical protein